MKYSLKILVLAFTFVFLFSSCSDDVEKELNFSNDMRGVWISVFDLPLPIQSKEEFSEKINDMFSDINSKNLNNVFVQVRAYSDALYPSDIFPFSAKLCGVQGKDPGFDPLEIMICCAHHYSLKFHAWINPYRISSDSDTSKLSSDNPALKLIEKNQGDIIFCDSGIYYDPASLPAQKLILDGVREIVKNYDVDGIHIDDYFYPGTDESIDEKLYYHYGGELSLEKWRMMNVNNFVSGMYSAVKAIDKNVTVSISPSGDIDSNYNVHYADVKKWLKEEGFADLIIPQIYFGFENEQDPFEKALNDWSSLPRSKSVSLSVGLAIYKAGKEDYFAGSGKYEWTQHSDIIKRQAKLSEEYGYVFFSYSYLSGPEWDNYFYNQ